MPINTHKGKEVVMRFFVRTFFIPLHTTNTNTHIAQFNMRDIYSVVYTEKDNNRSRAMASETEEKKQK